MIKPGNCLLSHFNCFLTSKLSWNIEDLKILALLIILWSLWIFLGHYCYFWYIQAIYVWRLISFYVTSDQNCLPRPSFPQRLREKSAREGPQFWWAATDGIGWSPAPMPSRRREPVCTEGCTTHDNAHLTDNPLQPTTGEASQNFSEWTLAMYTPGRRSIASNSSHLLVFVDTIVLNIPSVPNISINYDLSDRKIELNFVLLLN